MAKAPANIRSLCRAYTNETVRIVAGIAMNSESEAMRLQASQMLWERGWGRAKPDAESAERVTVTVRKIFEHHLVTGNGHDVKQPLTIEHDNGDDDGEASKEN
jgi:hypothetical protein